MKTQTTIYIVRHGEAVLPRGETVEKDKLRALTEHGREQIEKVGEYLANFPIEKVYCSDVVRVKESAEIIATSLGQKAEEHAGISEIYTNWDFQKTSNTIAETITDIVRQYSGKQVIVVTHQLVITEALKQLGARQKVVLTPCSQGELVRMVFAGETLVEAQKLSL